MANFTPLEKRVYVSTIKFTNLSNFAINQFICQNGERAGFRLEVFKDYESDKDLIISHIYDCTNGDPVYITSINVMQDFDLVGGLFSSGVFADGNIFSEFTNFRKINY